MIVMFPLWVIAVLWVIAAITRDKPQPPPPTADGLEVRL